MALLTKKGNYDKLYVTDLVEANEGRIGEVVAGVRQTFLTEKNQPHGAHWQLLEEWYVGLCNQKNDASSSHPVHHNDNGVWFDAHRSG